MADNAAKDENAVSTLLGVSNADNASPVKIWANPSTHRLLVSSSGGGGGSTLTAETPTGTVNDSNVTFTVANTPVFISVNGAVYTAGTGTFTSYAAGTITLSSAVGTGGFIMSYYNA